MARLGPRFPTMGKSWTASTPLPGGALGAGDMTDFLESLVAAYPDLDPDYLVVLAHRHGSLVRDVLGPAQRTADLGQRFGAGLYQSEVDYLVENEWAETATDVLWRRTKVGLHMDTAETAALDDYLAARETRAHATP